MSLRGIWVNILSCAHVCRVCMSVWVCVRETGEKLMESMLGKHFTMYAAELQGTHNKTSIQARQIF